MKVIEVYETNLPGNRTALKTDAEYTPYVICTNYNPEAKEGQQWDSSYGYYKTFAQMCKGIAKITIDEETRETLYGLLNECERMELMDKAYGEDSNWGKYKETLDSIIGG